MTYACGVLIICCFLGFWAVHARDDARTVALLKGSAEDVFRLVNAFRVTPGCIDRLLPPNSGLYALKEIQRGKHRCGYSFSRWNIHWLIEFEKDERHNLVRAYISPVSVRWPSDRHVMRDGEAVSPLGIISFPLSVEGHQAPANLLYLRHPRRPRRKGP